MPDHPRDPSRDPDLNPSRSLESHQSPRLSDGRQDLGDSLAHPVPREDRDLGQEFTQRNAYDGPRLGDEFADPARADQRTLGNAFADPNSLDDTRLGKSFEETNSSARKRHKSPRDVIKKPKSRKTLYLILTGVVIVFLIILVAGAIPRHERSKETREKADQEKNAKPVVEVVRVQYGKQGAGLIVPGTTTPLTEAPVYARANGYLKKRFVDIGDHVHKGQLLAIIDAPDLDQQVDQAREQVNQAEAQLAQQETQLALTKVTVDRYRALVAKGVFSRQDGDQQETNFQAQRANVASAARNVEAFQANLRRVIALQSYERVTAPFDGVVTQRNVDAGALISTSGAAGSPAPTPTPTPGLTNGSSQQAGATNTGGTSGSGTSLATPSTGGAQGGALFSVAQVDRLRILVSVPEGYANMIAPGQVASVHFQEFPDQDFYARVTRTSASLDQNSRTLLTEVQVDNRAGHLLSGMYAVVTFAPRPQSSPGNSANASTQAGPVVVPGDAIAIRNDRPTIAVIQNGTVKLTPVVIGRDYGSETEIMSGLKVGDLIATTFTDDIRDGVPVQIQEDKKAENKATPAAPPNQNTPPGGSTQYSDPGITDQDMQGQNAKPQQKKGPGDKKAAGSKGSQQ
jgi:multidrug efflux pump subunit AcrA (membrane-fusion protein)